MTARAKEKRRTIRGEGWSVSAPISKYYDGTITITEGQVIIKSRAVADAVRKARACLQEIEEGGRQ